VLLAEFLGTFALTFFGGGAICADVLLRARAPFGPVDLVLVAAAHAVVLAVMVTALGHISGAHFNPAVTLAALVSRRIEARLAGLYALAQFAGGLVGALLLGAVFSSAVTAAAAFGAPAPAAGVGALPAMWLEIILTFFLVTVIWATAIDPRGAFKSIAGFGIGATLFFDIVVGGPVTGAAMNPARAFGPALLAGILNPAHFLIYWAGPALGAVLAAVVYVYVLQPGDEMVEPTDVPPPAEAP
jgi:aquaporin Z